MTINNAAAKGHVRDPFPTLGQAAKMSLHPTEPNMTFRKVEEIGTRPKRDKSQCVANVTPGTEKN